MALGLGFAGLSIVVHDPSVPTPGAAPEAAASLPLGSVPNTPIGYGDGQDAAITTALPPAPTPTVSATTQPVASQGPGVGVQASGWITWASWYDAPARSTAHRTLPMGTRLLVCASSCVTVTVQDRGPYVEGRDLDLSRDAFAVLAPLSAGVVRVSYSLA